MNKYLFVGDLHGNINDAERAISHADDLKATIIQVGDWGFAWPNHNQIPDLQQLLETYSVKMLFIDGNHDWHASLAQYQATPELVYMPRGSTYTDSDGTTFLFLGGAPSIDRGSRDEGLSWWPTELITDSDVEKALAYTGKVDIVVTHDSPVIPYGFSDNVGSTWFRAQGPMSRDKLAQVTLHHMPKMLVHGHWHVRYTKDWNGIKIEGLDASYEDLESFCLPWSRLNKF